MENPQHLYMEASRLLDEGHIKEAYNRFLSAIEKSTQELHGVKFVHHTVVSKPLHYEASLALIRSSLTQLEEIAVERSPAKSIHLGKSSPHIPTYPSTSHTPSHTPLRTTEDDNQSLKSDHSSSRAKTPPPLPPKPARMKKPTVPPKPNRVPPAPQSSSQSSSMKPTPQSSSSTSALSKGNNRARGNSVSFAEKTSDHEISDDDDYSHISDEDDDDDDDDDDEGLVIFDGENNNNNDESARRNGRPSFDRPHTMTETMSSSQAYESRPRSLTASHKRSKSSPIDVWADSVVDASMLVPAQTNTGDSLAPPMSANSTEYVPNIPVPPLLTTHRRLQDELDELEASLLDYKTKKRSLARTDGSNDATGQAERELDEKILQQTNAVATTRETLNKVRTLYMSAATVPNVMQFPPHMVAYQLTLIESAIFRDIPADALLTHSARTPHPKVVASTDFFNYITRAIEHSILLPQEASRRAELINRWIKIAAKCLSLNNYQTLKAIVSALGTPPVQRLRRTWDCIPKKRMGKLDFLNALMSESQNYERYREHMGLETKRRWRVPVVPFLGIFIHDMTYLLAAVKGSAQEDPRVQDILMMIRNFQSTPSYPARPPLSYVKAAKKHSFRPTAITNALHRSSSAKSRMSNSALYGVDLDDQDRELDLQQQLITQYLLMRPWVHEKIIDELSILREPPKPRFNAPGYGRANSNGTSIQSNNVSNSTYSSSILSNASSLVRIGSSYSTNTSSITSWEEQHDDTKKERTGFWPFRKSSEMNRPTTLQSDIYVDHTTRWTDDEDDDYEQDTSRTTHETFSSRAVSTTSRILSGHVRSLSLPSSRPNSITEAYHSPNSRS